jgi:Pyruvate/2-oxoacid:ferredoxin oxidoreductase delta subunit
MRREPKRQAHPNSVYLIGIFVWLIILFVLAGVVNHLAFSSRGPGLLIPLLKKIQKKESPIMEAFRKHKEAQEHLRFHRIADAPPLPEALRSTCFICHSYLPHNKTKKIRAMLNMHTNYLACETCHLEKKEEGTVVYRWYSPVEKDPKGPFFGTAYDPETGELVMTHDYFSKIAPFYEENGKLTPILHMQNAPMARDYVRIRDQLTPEQREGVTKRFHVDILAKGPDCQTCHSTKSILDFKALGFSPNRIVDIEQLNIKGIITKYDEFYLPDLFK